MVSYDLVLAINHENTYLHRNTSPSCGCKVIVFQAHILTFIGIPVKVVEARS